jgi:hypothetical protein
VRTRWKKMAGMSASGEKAEIQKMSSFRGKTTSNEDEKPRVGHSMQKGMSS